MPSRRAVRALLAAALAALTGVLGGCATDDDIQAGEHVTVYVSVPLRGPSAAEGGHIARAAKLALRRAGGRVGELRVRAVYLDDSERGGWTQARAAANARRAAEDSTAIAYIGDFESGATRTSLPITNEAGMLQVSPASSAVDLVAPFPGSEEVPDEVQATGDRTFGRVIPRDDVQASTAAAWAKRLGARGVLTQSDGSTFGEEMRARFVEEARSLGIRPEGLTREAGLHLPRGGLFGSPPPERNVACVLSLVTVDLIYAAGSKGPTGLLSPCAGGLQSRFGVMASDALLAPSALQTLRQTNREFSIVSAAQDPSQLPPEGQRFVRAYRESYGREPGRYAAYGYEAMAVVLDAIERAGEDGAERDAVIDAFLETENRDSVLGTYSIDEVGDTTLDRLAGYRVEGERLVFERSLRVP
jgi:branched-chain amino acid transport system substrate-binding protein